MKTAVVDSGPTVCLTDAVIIATASGDVEPSTDLTRLLVDPSWSGRSIVVELGALISGHEWRSSVHAVAITVTALSGRPL